MISLESKRSAYSVSAGQNSRKGVSKGTVSAPFGQIMAAAFAFLFVLTNFQPLAAQPLHMNVRNWHAEHGLLQNSVNAIVQNADGYLWLGTGTGVVRFDGVDFVRYRASNDVHVGDWVSALALDSDGVLWVGTDRGVATLSNGRFENRLPSTSDRRIRSLSAAPDGSIWAASYGSGVIRFSSDGARPDAEAIAGLPDSSDVLFASDGSTWVASMDRTLLRRQGPGLPFVAVDVPTHAPSDQPQTSMVFSLCEHADGSILLGTSDGLLRWRNGELEAIPFPGHADVNVTQIARHPDGHYWVATHELGLVRFDSELQVGRPIEGQSDWVAQSIFFDSEGNTWVGFDGGGLARLTPSHVEVIGPENGLPGSSASAVFRDADGGLWVSGAPCSGVVRLVDGVVEQYVSSETGLANDCVWAIEEFPRGTMWFGSWGGGLTQYDREARQLGESYGPEQGLSEDILAVFADRAGLLWIGSRQGVAQFDGEQMTVRPVEELRGFDARHFFEDADGTIWISSVQGVLSVFEGRTALFNSSQGLQNETARQVFRTSSNQLLVATYGAGLHYFDGSRFERIGPDRGLHDDFLSHVFEDSLGRIWLAGNTGLTRFTLDDLDDLISGRLEVIEPIRMTEQDGLPDRECNGGSQSSAFLDGAGGLFVPTMGGVAIVDTRRVDSQPHAVARVRIEQVTAGRRLIPFVNHSQLALGSEERDVEVRFTGFSYRSPERLVFRFRIDDGNWRFVAGHRAAELTNLDSGHHRFEVQARVADRAWSESDTLDLVVSPTWHETTLFRGTASFALVLLLAGVLHTFRKRHLHVKRLLERRTALAEANEELIRMTNIDVLTGVASRRFFEQAYTLHWAVAGRTQTPLSVVMIDVDKFKDLNDRYGHLAGDRCLAALAARMRETVVREADLLARWGGEEFVAVLPDTNAEGAHLVAARLVERIAEKPIDLGSKHKPVHVTISAGVATVVPTPKLKPSALLDAGDRALYAAKRAGRNCVAQREVGPPKEVVAKDE